MLQQKKILIAITGSIAAYKIPYLVRSLIKEGAEVRIIMTKASTNFVSSLTLSTLSKNPVLVDLFDKESWANHVMLGRWADMMIIAPASCNTLSKMASGACDNLLLATYLSSTCPVMVAPAMDEDMWNHTTTKQNIDKIKTSGAMIMPVDHGELASGLVGDGRMAEPEAIIIYIKDYFNLKGQLIGKKALVTAGPTYEAIDPVRFIGNHSSGKMGYAIADELRKRGAEVTLVSGPVTIKSEVAGIRKIDVTSAEEMYTACADQTYDIAVMSAAVADYRPLNYSEQKIKKGKDELSISLQKTKDVLKHLGGKKNEKQILVGFALETENEEQNAQKKLLDKNADIIVLNSLNNDGSGFGHDTNNVTIYFKNGEVKPIGLQTKNEIAKHIVDSITKLLE